MSSLCDALVRVAWVTELKRKGIIRSELNTVYFYFLSSSNDIIIDFRDRGREGGERERETLT